MKFNALVPELSVTNLERSKWFYTDLLGFCIEYERENDKFAFLSLNNAQIMLEEVNGHWQTGIYDYPLGRGVNFQITVENIQSIIDRLNQHNISLFRQPFISEYETGTTVVKEIEFLVQDPDGYLLRFSQSL